MGDWIFTALTWLLLVVGLIGLSWAMLWDRSRGRKRCPKCWYGLDGVPDADGGITCPECGKLTSKPRKLSKTRRRWALALLPVLLLLGSFASYWYPQVRDNGLHPVLRSSPDIVLIALLPWVDSFDYANHSFSGRGNYFSPELWRRLEGKDDCPERHTWRTGELNALEAWAIRKLEPVLYFDPEWRKNRSWAIRLLVPAYRGHLPFLPPGDECEAVIEMSRYAYVSADRFQVAGVIDFEDGTPYTLFTIMRDRDRSIRHDEAVVAGGVWSAVPNAIYRWDDPDDWDPTFWWIQDPDLETIFEPWHPIVHELLNGGWGPLYDLTIYAGIQEYRGRPCHVLRSDEGEGFLHATVWIDVETNFILRRLEEGYLDARYLLPDTDWATDPAASPLPAKLDAINALLPDVDLLNANEQGG